VRLIGELVDIGQGAVHDGIEVIALWNAPFHTAEPSDVPVEVRLALTLLQQPLDELGGGAVRLAGIGVMLDLVFPDRVVVLLLRMKAELVAAKLRAAQLARLQPAAAVGR